jgi:hypothetical protein
MNRFFMVGVFVIAGLALFTTGLFMIGNRHEAFARHVELYTEFSDVSGVVPGAKVQAKCLPWKSQTPRLRSSGSKFASMRSSVGSCARRLYFRAKSRLAKDPNTDYRQTR